MILAKYFVKILFWCCICHVANGFSAIKIFAAASSADCPTIDESSVKITSPDCNKTNGSIIGLIVNSTGTKITYRWHNAVGDVISTGKDLTNIGEGTYTLEVTDNSGCSKSVFSSPFIIEMLNGVSIGTTNVKITVATCKTPGSITGLHVSGATDYSWREINSGIVYKSSSTADIFNIPQGYYKLTASNSNTGCSANSDLYILNGDFTPPLVTASVITPPQCDALSNKIAVTLNMPSGGPQLNYIWKNSDNVVVDGNRLVQGVQLITVNLNNAASGTYGLYVQSDLLCPVLLGTYTMPEASININVKTSQVYNDVCNQHLGAIVPDFTGVADARNTKFIWYSNGEIVSRSKSLFRIGAGEYNFYIEAPNCSATATFTIADNSPELTPPIANGSTICLPGVVGIKVTNPDTAGIFKLYANENDTVPLDTSISGEFYRSINKSTDFYIARAHGRCESIRTKVTETVTAAINIPNTFTPNNDGINDFWNITGIKDFPGAGINVFARDGSLVYHSIDYATPFDGRTRGRLLPAGVYYYIVEVKQTACFGKISGSLTLIR